MVKLERQKADRRPAKNGMAGCRRRPGHRLATSARQRRTGRHPRRAGHLHLPPPRRIPARRDHPGGDNADLAEFGKYRLTPAFQQTTQATIDRLALFVADLRARCPKSRIIWLAGNHEERLPNFILDNAARCVQAPTGQHARLIGRCSPRTCAISIATGSSTCLDIPPTSTGSTSGYAPSTATGEVGGSTAHVYLASEKVSTIYGPVCTVRVRASHPRGTMMALRRSWLPRPVVSPALMASCPRPRGHRPRRAAAADRRGLAAGFAIVNYEPGDGRFTYHNVAIP